MPTDFPAPILVAQPVSPEPRSQIADLLSRHTLLCVKEAQQGESPQPGWVYVTPSVWHIQVCPDQTPSLAQDEESSKFTGMPFRTAETGCADFIRPLEKITPTLVEILAAQVPRLCGT